jgi:hypothetical protein
MRMEYEIEEQDFCEAYGLTLRSFSRYNRELFRFIVGIFFLLVPVAAFLLHVFQWGYLVPVPFAMLLLLCPWLIRRQMRSIYRKADNLRGKILADIDETGVAFSTSEGESKTKWNGFQRYAEGPRVFALITATRVFHILPKRGLAQTELDALRALIVAHVPSKRA